MPYPFGLVGKFAPGQAAVGQTDAGGQIVQVRKVINTDPAIIIIAALKWFNALFHKDNHKIYHDDVGNSYKN
jgi:hypothetical protein